MRNLIIFSFVFLLIGCPTPYQQKGDLFSSSGYSNFPIGKDSAYISYAGPQRTPRETVEKYFLYRCAEYTLAKNFSYFLITETNIDVSESRHFSPDRVDTKSKKNDDGTLSKHTHISHGSETLTYAFTKNGTIKMFKNNSENPDAYNAMEIRDNLEPFIERGHY